MATMATHAKQSNPIHFFIKETTTTTTTTLFPVEIVKQVGSSLAMAFASSQQVKNHQTIKTRNVP